MVKKTEDRGAGYLIAMRDHGTKMWSIERNNLLIEDLIEIQDILNRQITALVIEAQVAERMNGSQIEEISNASKE